MNNGRRQLHPGSGAILGAMPGTANASAGSNSALRVLLVDDHAPLLTLLASAFTGNGCAVSTALTAEQALDLLADHSFDLVVSDIKMPGLSGLDLLRAVKGRHPETPVVLITGAPSLNSAVFGLRHGAYDYLTKPFSITDVAHLIQRVRKDRERGNGHLGLPAGLMEELARRQVGVEVLSRIGELALQGLPPKVLMDTVLDYVLQSLRSDAALIVLRDQNGNFTHSDRGDPALLHQLLRLLHASFDDLLKTDGKATLTLTETGYSFEALAAVIPGVGTAMGILCLGRDVKHGAFLPDEKGLLFGYAQTMSLALQKVILRENLERSLVDTIASFVNALESKDVYLKGHSARVALYGGEIATTMGLTPADALLARRAGLLHDLGKLVVLDSILHKPDRLTEEEYALIKHHPLIAEKILRPLRFLAEEVKAVKHHHERYDGTGYPDGLKGDEIPLAARIVTVADSFDAMTSNRPYRRALPIDVALREILRGTNAQFDPRVADALAAIPSARLVEISHSYDTQALQEPATSHPHAEARC